jgi:hypothetical protein
MQVAIFNKPQKFSSRRGAKQGVDFFKISVLASFIIGENDGGVPLFFAEGYMKTSHCFMSSSISFEVCGGAHLSF